MQVLRRLDDGLARGEAAVAAITLFVMIFVAAAQALLRNLTNFDLQWANEALASIDGADSFLQKGTLWLAFLGASLATHDNKQIAIDIIPRVAPPKVRAAMRGVVGLAAGVTAFFLAWVFFVAILNIGADRPLEYEVLVDDGEAVHICDAPKAAVDDAGLDRPLFFCAARGTLSALGAPVETPGAAAQLVVPAMFVIVAIRLLLNGIGALRMIPQGGIKQEDVHSGLEAAAEYDEEQEREHAGGGRSDREGGD
ncbi:MAG: TRAP transporter small permease [Polyangiales bacterium]